MEDFPTPEGPQRRISGPAAPLVSADTILLEHAAMFDQHGASSRAKEGAAALPSFLAIDGCGQKPQSPTVHQQHTCVMAKGAPCGFPRAPPCSLEKFGETSWSGIRARRRPPVCERLHSWHRPDMLPDADDAEQRDQPFADVPDSWTLSARQLRCRPALTRSAAIECRAVLGAAPGVDP